MLSKRSIDAQFKATSKIPIPFITIYRESKYYAKTDTIKIIY